jgi:hypothetical protein
MTLDYFKDMVFPDTFKELTDDQSEHKEPTEVEPEQPDTFVFPNDNVIPNLIKVKLKNINKNKRKKVNISPLMANLLNKLK